jgi:hypothetical protein
MNMYNKLEKQPIKQGEEIWGSALFGRISGQETIVHFHGLHVASLCWEKVTSCGI